MFNIIFPDYYSNDEFAQFETESKGYLFGVKMIVDKDVYELVFYDLARLKQDSEDEQKESNYFHEPNLIILERVSKDLIIKAVTNIYNRGEVQYLLKD